MTSIDFKFEATSGLNGQLSDYRGQYVVLYFYPKDNTPGCTTESKDFTTLHDQFTKKNTIVFGISKDSLKSHENFKAKFQMPFELIADADKTICEQFEVLKEKSMFGKKYMGIERSTFLINPQGEIEHEWRKVKVSGHAQAVLEKI